MRTRWLMFLVLAFLPAIAQAQALSDRVPSDALLYLSWQGADHLPAGYDQTHLKKLLDDSNLRELFDTIMPSLIARVAQEDKNAAAGLTIFSGIAGPMWRHPTAFYSSGVDFAGAAGPAPRIGILCDAGKEADAVLAQLNQLLQQANAPAAPFNIKAFKRDSMVGLIIGYADEAVALAADASKSLASSDRFKQALAQVQKEPMCVCYIDIEGIVQQFTTAITQFAPPAEQQMMMNIHDAIGIGGIKRLIVTGGFDGQDWGSQCFIAAPGPRTGIATMLDASPMSDEALKAIPSTATVAGIGRFNIGRLFSEIRTAAGKINPQFQQAFDQGMGIAQMGLGFNLQKDLFESLGDEWAYYLDPQSSGQGLLGITIVNHLAKADDANRALKKLELAMDNAINGQIPPQEKVRINFEQFTHGDLTIHYVAVPFVSPSWAIRDNYLFAGLYPQVVAAANENAKGKSILDNPNFQALRKRLGGEKATSFSYFDLPQTIDGNYQLILAGSQGLFGLADLFGVKTPPMIMPSLKSFRQNLTPAGSFAWTDDAGWHSRAVSPVPGGEILASQGGIIAVAPLVLGIAMPAAAKARAQAAQVQGMNNLRQIGQGAMIYANDHKGKYPPDLGTLLVESDLGIQAFVSPKSGKVIPPNIRAAKPEDQAVWVNENADYIYVGAGMKPVDGANQVLAYERPGIARNGASEILYNDGHVEVKPTAALMQELKEQGKVK